MTQIVEKLFVAAAMAAVFIWVVMKSRYDAKMRERLEERMRQVTREREMEKTSNEAADVADSRRAPERHDDPRSVSALPSWATRD